MSQRESNINIQQAINNLSKATEEFCIELEPAALKIQEITINIHDMFYEEYKKVGFPYGDSEEGMLEWLRVRRFKEGRKYREYYKKEVKQMIDDIKRK